MGKLYRFPLKCARGSRLQAFLVAPLILATILLSTLAGYAQDRTMVRGKVLDEKGTGLSGATITVSGTTRGAISDLDGSYYIEAKPTDVLVVSFLGMETQNVDINNRTTVNIILKDKADELEAVTIVAFGKQKKESVISSIETVRVDDLRVPSSNLTTAFAGRMAGMISYQTSGEPGQDNAEFFIRGVASFGTGKVNPLILVDNIEVSASDLSRLHPDDIASFSILKDATGTALYGARAANGVILVTTKEGKEGTIKVSFRLENAFSSPTRMIEMADPITYMNLANEAVKTRNPLEADIYSQSQIENTIRGTNSMVYPATDWMDQLFKNVAINQKANLNISGGGKVAQYYIAGSFAQDNGIMKVDNRNNFNNNIDLKKYLIRSNITLQLTKSTLAKVRMYGTFEDYMGPIPGGTRLFQDVLAISPTRFPAYYEPDAAHQAYDHILFGNYNTGGYMNPYAEMVKGYREENKSTMSAQFEVEQDFSFLLKGLKARALASTTRYSQFSIARAYNPFYYYADPANYNRLTDVYTLTELNTATGTEYLSYDPADRARNINTITYGEAAISYARDFGKNSVSGMLVGIARSQQAANEKEVTLAKSLVERNLGLSGRFTYAYDNRYLGEFNFGYNGSEKFDQGHRWGFFPSIGLGWHVSNENFWSEGIKKVIPKLKLKGTYGLVGNDAIGSERFFYLSDVSIGRGRSYTTGLEFTNNKSGVKINSYPNPQITWELAYKTNVGIELGLFKGFEALIDLFQERRTRILQTRADISDELGLWDVPQANVGEAKSKGIDVSLDYKRSLRNGLWFVGRGTFTYARSTYSYYEESDYSEVPWRSRNGQPIKQTWGYVSERLFIDWADIANSPRQDLGGAMPGDIKYKDINGDNIINELDMVPIGYPTTPEINYGFGLSAGYKSFDISFFFQGSARSSFWVNADAMSPFIKRTQYSDGTSHPTTEGGLTQFIANDYWSEGSQNPYAYWPRLSTYLVSNNTVTSTRFMENGAFLRLKSAEIGYSLPQKLTHKIGMDKCRFYANGTNLFLISSFKLWDVEMGGNGMGYPLQRMINVGINISF